MAGEKTAGVNGEEISTNLNMAGEMAGRKWLGEF